MTLVPEDILNKSFTATQFRRGYDEQEVDDFLDDVVAELRRVGAENADLKGRVGDGPPTAAGPDGTDVREAHGQARHEIERVNKETAERIATAVARAEAAEKEAEERIAQAATASATGSDLAAAVTDQAMAADAAGVIVLAQKVHDEYVAQGKAEHDRLVGEASGHRDAILHETTTKRDAMLHEATHTSTTLVREAEARHEELITTAQARHDELVTTAQARHEELTREARATHEHLVGEARERSNGMIAEAEHRKRSVLSALENERAVLERAIAELHSFEDDYRDRLRGFIQGQLERLGEVCSVLPDGAGEPQDRHEHRPEEHEHADHGEHVGPGEHGEHGEHGGPGEHEHRD